MDTEARVLRAVEVVACLVEDEARWCDTTPRALDANLEVNMVEVSKVFVLYQVIRGCIGVGCHRGTRYGGLS